MRTYNGAEYDAGSFVVRIVLDEDVPPDLAAHLRARGFDAVAIDEIRAEVWPGAESISDDEVCVEVTRRPSVLVTLNTRDYSDRAFIQKLVEEHRVSVVQVRPPKAESKASARSMAIRDIVHRHAPRIAQLYGPEPSIASVNRSGLRARLLREILQ